jgi:secondary thiamine-phosphate synthase enzyme
LKLNNPSLPLIFTAPDVPVEYLYIVHFVRLLPDDQMKIKTVVLHYKKPSDEVYLTDMTRQVEHSIVDSGMNDGIAIIHTECSNTCITTMEYEPGSIHDMQMALTKLIPNGHANGHSEHNGNGLHANASQNGHVKQDIRPSLIGSSITVPFKDNREMLGKWQKAVLIDFGSAKDEKRVIVQIIGE